MPSTVELASALQALSDDALDALVRARHVPQHAATYFDVADQLLRPESVAMALETLTVAELDELATGRTSARLDALGLGVAGVAFDEARGQAAQAPGTARAGTARAGAAQTVTAQADDTAEAGARAQADDAVAAEQAFATVLLVGEAVRAMQSQPVQLLARGAVSMADARRLAEALAVDVDDVLAAIDLARGSRLLVPRETALLTSTDAEPWLALPLPDRWARLRDGWLERLSHHERLVATDASATFPLASAATLERLDRIVGLAVRLGLRLARHGGGPTSLQGPGGRDRLAALVPVEIATAYVQPDLSIVVPGPLEPSLEQRLRAIADLEQRGTASTYRLSLASLSRGLAAGETEASMLELLEALSLSGLPQPVAYLVRDAAARFGAVRVLELHEGPDRTAVRGDEAAIAEVEVDHGLVALRLRRTAPGRLETRSEPATVLAALRARRYPAALEDADGRLLAPTHHVAEPVAAPPTPLVQRLRGSGFDVGSEERAWLERRLSIAARDKVSVQVRVAFGAEERELALLPLGVANGRLRARDLVSDVERTLPVTAITHLTGVP